MGTSADAIFVLEKIYLLLVGMAFLEKGKNTSFTACHAAATGQSGIYFILCDKPLDRWHLRQLGREGFTRQVQVTEPCQHPFQVVIMEPQQRPVILMGSQKLLILVQKCCPKRRICQLPGKPRGLLRETIPLNVGKALQVSGVPGFLT